MGAPVASPSSRARRVVVTGARGFLGGHLVQAARARGDQVLEIVRERAESRLGTQDVLSDPAQLDGWLRDGSAEHVVSLCTFDTAGERRS